MCRGAKGHRMPHRLTPMGTPLSLDSSSLEERNHSGPQQDGDRRCYAPDEDEIEQPVHAVAARLVTRRLLVAVVFGALGFTESAAALRFMPFRTIFTPWLARPTEPL